jgi:Peptidase A4 family
MRPASLAGVIRGAAAVVAVASFFACAPAWAGTVIDVNASHAAGHPKAVARGLMGQLPARVLAGVSARRDVQLKAAPAHARPKGHFAVSPGRLTYRGGHVSLAWSSSHATRCTLSASPRFWTGANPARVRCRGKIRVTVPAVALGSRWKFTFKASTGKGRSTVVHRTFALQAPPFATSINWAGYAISGTAVTKATGEFRVPTLHCNDTTNGSEAMWVGIGGDGAATGDLLQTGVESSCSLGIQVESPAWWEEYPEYVSDDFQGLTVSPGDLIQASVYEDTDGSWFTRLDDLTTRVSGVMHTGDSWGTVEDATPTVWVEKEGDASGVTYSGGTSAEWIIEDFAFSNGTLVPFANFGNVAFSNLTTSLPAWSLTAADAIGLRNRKGLLLAAPSAHASPSGGFSVVYTG